MVTGGSGFIGAALVHSLCRAGHNVRVFDNNSRGSLERLTGAEVEFIEGDIRHPEAVVEACAGMDAVWHLAYINGTANFYERPALVLEVGVKGMVNVLDGCRRHQVPELLLMSSSEVYQTPAQVPTPESVPLVVPDPLNPRFSYGGGKIISELMALNYGRTDFERVLIVRPHNVFGPDMGFDHVIPQFAARLHKLRDQPRPVTFPIQGDGSETRAFVYIDDFVAGVDLLHQHGRHLEIYHVGNDVESTIAEVAQLTAEAMQLPIQLEPGPLLAGSTPRRCPDLAKLRALGYQPQVSLAEGIGRYVDWFLQWT
ncbi:MAG: NAD(P)-dependent oxidoreductase [Candidatus Eremiobacteraeota bacterium]|nr:NAD(P)-dependent oxidoreductase [Candidatus Eremiobacteraeota bacterium]